MAIGLTATPRAYGSVDSTRTSVASHGVLRNETHADYGRLDLGLEQAARAAWKRRVSNAGSLVGIPSFMEL